MFNAGGNNPPAIPGPLVEALTSNQASLFFGPGMSSHFGLHNRFTLMKRLIKDDEVGELKDISGKLLQMLEERRRAEPVAEIISSRITPQRLVDVVHKILRRTEVKRTLPSWGALSNLPFVGAITTSYDDLLEKIYEHRLPLILKGSSTDDVASAFDEARFVIAKLYGDVHSPETFRFTASEKRHGMIVHDPLVRVVTSLLNTKCLLFVGSSVTGLQEFFSDFPVSRGPNAPPHYAIIPRSDFAELQKQSLLQRYGVELLLFDRDQDFTQVEQFLVDLDVTVRKSRFRMSTNTQAGQLTLESVRLKNIGPFPELDVNLNEKWNLIIGNNAVGKSTLLRAIAVGLCGDDPQTAVLASKILKNDETQGSIELSLGGNTYRTDLFREVDRVRTLCKQISPLQRGSLVALGFPPLRGFDVNLAQTVLTSSRSKPSVADLLPLLQSGPDMRIGDLKTWILGNYTQDQLRTANHGTSPSELKAEVSLNRKFFELLSTLVPDEHFAFHSADLSNNEVFVETVDGVVSLDQISQGMMSLLAWLGTLLERMYEVHPESAMPNLETALVLIDELDAHLHPEWQQRLVPLLKQHFPNTQIIATTHSPLLVAELKRTEIFVARRTLEGRPTLAQSMVDPAGLRSDQVLTSVLFGLVTTRSSEFSNQVDEYADLFGKTGRSPAEEIRLHELSGVLKGSLKGGETETQRAKEAIIDLAISSVTNPEQIFADLDHAAAAKLREGLLSHFKPEQK